jgi:uncharacterized membrane protein
VIAPSEEPPDGHPAGTPAGPLAGSAPAAGAGTDDPQVEASAAERVVFFSDAVVAIAITLLALALPVPRGFPSMTNSQLLDALREDRAGYIAFLISFLVIGNHWAVHRQIFRYVNRVNRKIGLLNMGWLLMMIVTPFATRMLSGSGAFGVRFTIYAMVQVIASACLLLMSREIARGGLLRPGAPESARHPDHAPSLAIIAAFLASIPVAYFSGWAFAVWAAIPLLVRLLRPLLDGRRYTTGSPGRRRPAGRPGR